MLTFRCSKCGAFNRVAEGREGTPVCGRCKQTLETAGLPQAVNTGELFAALEASPLPVLVDFWAPWCGPCRMAAPVLEQVARAQAGKVAVLKLNTDENPGPSAQFKISGIPAFLLFQGGRETARQEGLLPAHQFSAWLSQRLGH